MYWNPNKYLINKFERNRTPRPSPVKQGGSNEEATRRISTVHLIRLSVWAGWPNICCREVSTGGGKDKILVEYQYGRKSLAQIISFLACLSNKHHQNRVPGGPHFIQILLHNMLICCILSQLFSVPINLASCTPSFVAWAPFVCSGDGGFGLAQR